MESNFHHFAAIRGVQAGRAYFAIMCPLRVVPKLFQFDDDSVRADLRAQRVINRTRVPVIARYIADHSREYVLSSLCASVDGELDFQPAGTSEALRCVGVLRVGMSATILINDGQHRRAAIEEAVRERPELGDETISVVIFADRGLKRSQQMFADLNVHAVRPTKSIRLLYDHRDEMAQLVRGVVQEIPLFREFTDLEKTSLPHRGTKLFTLSALHQATSLLLAKGRNARLADEDREFVVRFWNAVIRHMPDWQAVGKKAVAAAELRPDYIHAHGVAIQAIALAGVSLIAQYPKDWADRLSALSTVDWSRTNTELWEGRALVGGKINRASQNVQLIANVLMQEMGLSLTKDGRELEARVFPLSAALQRQAS